MDLERKKAMEVTAQRIFLVLLGVVMGYAIRVVVSRREEERREVEDSFRRELNFWKDITLKRMERYEKRIRALEVRPGFDAPPKPGDD